MIITKQITQKRFINLWVCFVIHREDLINEFTPKEYRLINYVLKSYIDFVMFFSSDRVWTHELRRTTVYVWEVFSIIEYHDFQRNLQIYVEELLSHLEYSMLQNSFRFLNRIKSNNSENVEKEVFILVSQFRIFLR